MQELTDKTDEELISLCKADVEEAFTQLYLRYRQPIMGFANNMLRNKEDAADVFQETFRYVFTKIRSFKHNAKFSTFIYQVARHVCIDVIRKRKRSKEKFVQVKSDSSGQLNPLFDLERKELSKELEEAVYKLPEYYREVILLRYGQGLSYEEISQVLLLPLGTVRSRIHNAISQLKDQIFFKIRGEL